MDVNKLLGYLGNPGRYTIAVYLLLCLNYFPITFNHLLMSVYSGTPSHRCKLPDGLEASNSTLPMDAKKKGSLDSCHIYVNYTRATNVTTSCPMGYHYTYTQGLIPEFHESTIVNEWNLVCDQKFMPGVSTSIYFAGVMLGGLVFGTISDQIGRKPVMLFTLYAYVLFGVMLYFVENFILFSILRFIIGFLMQGLQLGTYVMAMELFSAGTHRAYVAGILECFWATGIMLLAGIAYIFKNWRYIQLAISIPSAVTIVYIWVMPESIRWLATHRRYQGAERALQTAAKFNKVELPEDPLELKAMGVKAEDELDENVKTYTIVDMFRTKTLAKRSLVMFFIWLATSLGYYGLSLNASRLAGDKYLNFFINGAIEFPAYASGIYILSRFGRKYPLLVYFVIGGAACIAAGLIPKTAGEADISWVSTMLAWIGKFSTAGSFSVIFLYASELYPTVMRNVGVGACAFWARVGSLIAPQINTLGVYTYNWLPTVIFGSMLLIAALLTLLLPETYKQKLPDTIEETERMQNQEEETAPNEGKGRSQEDTKF